MGQCYTVEMKIKGLNKDRIIQETNKFLATQNVSGDIPATFAETMKYMLSENVTVTESINDEARISSDFCAGYGWHCVMTDWFEALSPVFGNGTEMVIYPDEGCSKSVVKNGVGTTKYLDWADLTDESTDLKDIWEKTEKALLSAGIDDEAILNEIKSAIGEYGELETEEIKYRLSCYLDENDEDFIKTLEILNNVNEK